MVGTTSPARDHGFHPLTVKRVVSETADACSIIFEVPPELALDFSYEAGQFCNLRVSIGGEDHVRCYSMSSAPSVDPELQVTVKRVPDGVVSNWLNDRLSAGDLVEVSLPAGFFQLTPTEGPLVAFAAGSGITPVFSLIKTALATTGRDVRLLYANRDGESVIFGNELAALAERHGPRLEVVHHLDAERGFVDEVAVRAFDPPGAPVAEYYVCGPAPFMEVVEATLLAEPVEPARIHIERFTPAELPRVLEAEERASDGVAVTIELDGRTETTEHHPGTTILQTARQVGMAPPYSCESGSCATCMARLLDGQVSMYVNNALTPDEVAEGWILTCQSVPTSSSVHVVYGYED
jgi:3-ketosteroid 9alpha-monooxygenase subunit B